jgi:probable F420-dependent oxidoreductase
VTVVFRIRVGLRSEPAGGIFSQVTRLPQPSHLRRALAWPTAISTTRFMSSQCRYLRRMPDIDLGRFGAWWSGTWKVAEEPDVDTAAEMERLGYGALWSSGGFEPGLSAHFGKLLAATRSIPVASGIVSIWAAHPDDLGPAVAALEAAYDDRFLLGIGTSHSAVVADYSQPYSKMVAFLDALDALEAPISPKRRIIAALGTRMLELAAERSLGAHPYFVPAEHTELARRVLGADPLLATEVAVVLETDPVKARALARTYASIYLGLPNYTENLRRLGYGDDDLGGGGSDRLIDAVIPWGDVATIVARLRQHLDAGADHVCVQLVADRQGFPLAEYRELAPALTEI